MRLLTTNQIHCLSYRGMHYNASDAIITWDYLSRYTEYCDEVTVLVRSREVESVDPALPRIDGPGVRIQALPDPLSAWAGILSLPALVRRIWQALRLADAGPSVAATGGPKTRQESSRSERRAPQ